MIRRNSIAATATLLACGLGLSLASAGQSALTDAQRDYIAGRYNRAVDALTNAVAKAPDDASLLFLLGQSYYQLREYTRSVASLERAVELSPKQSQYRNWLGKAYGRKAEEGMFLGAMTWARKAHREFEAAVELDPQNFEAQRDLIRYEMNAPGIVGGGDEKALKHIDALEKLDHLQGELARGEFLSTKKRIPEADAVFGQILEADTNRAGVYLEAAEYYRDHQNADKMAAAVADAERVDPDDRRLKFYKGILFVMHGTNSSEAELLLKSYLTTVPDNSDFPPHSVARYWLGKLYESQGRFSEAANEYRLSLSLDPHDKEVAEALKRVQRK